MSRTYRKQPLRNQFRHPRTFNEIRSNSKVASEASRSPDYLDTEYTVSTRNRYIPTAWDDITATSIYQNDYTS